MTVLATVPIEQATEAFVEALPAIACLGPEFDPTGGSSLSRQLSALRHFQEWLARCGEIKYGALDHLSLADRTAGILQNVFERRTVESVVIEAMTPAQSDRFEPSEWPPPEDLPKAELSILIAAWKQIELSSLPVRAGWPSVVAHCR